MDLPPFPSITWPDCADCRRAALLVDAQMAEAEALWQLRARALRHQAGNAADPDLLTPAEIAYFRSLPPGTPYTPEQIERLRRDQKAAGRRIRELLDQEKAAEPKAG